MLPKNEVYTHLVSTYAYIDQQSEYNSLERGRTAIKCIGLHKLAIRNNLGSHCPIRFINPSVSASVPLTTLF